MKSDSVVKIRQSGGTMIEPMDLKAIRERCESAIPGPWRRGARDSFNDNPRVLYAGPWPFAEFNDEPNLEFCAHARADIPALLFTVEELAKALEAVLNWMGPGQRNHPDMYDSVREDAWDNGQAALRKIQR